MKHRLIFQGTGLADWLFAAVLALLTLLLLWTTPAAGQVIYPPASQAEVNAGTITTKFVSPATLKGAGGGGTVINNNFYITNASGTVYGFVGVESNATIAAGGSAFPLNGDPSVNSAGTLTGLVESNQVYLISGTVLGPFCAQFGYYGNDSARSGTNVIGYVYTNGVGSGETLTFSSDGLQTNLNTLALVAPSYVCIVWSNSPSAINLSGCVMQWSLGQQIPAGVASVVTTNQITVAVTNVNGVPAASLL